MKGRHDHAALAVEPFAFEHAVFFDGEPIVTQQIEEVLLVGRSAEIDRGEVLELGFDEVHEAGPSLEQGLGKDDLAAGLEPAFHSIQDEPRVAQEHEAHAEENAVKASLLPRGIVFRRALADVDVVLQPVFSD